MHKKPTESFIIFDFFFCDHVVCYIFLVRDLLKKGVSADVCNEDGLTALHQVLYNNISPHVSVFS